MKLNTRLCCLGAIAVLMAGCAQRTFTPSTTGQTNDVGWRDANKHLKEKYSPQIPHRTILSSLGTGSLISVKPSGFYVLSQPELFTKNVLKFKLDGHLYELREGTPFFFTSDKDVVVSIDGKTTCALPSDKIQVDAEQGLNGEVWVRLPKRISGRSEMTVKVTLGSDVHEFKIRRGKAVAAKQLALIPYFPIWSDENPPIVENKEEKKQQVVRKVEELTKDIKSGLKSDLAGFIADLRNRKELTEDTRVDVNAEVMPEVAGNGQLEYNMKVRYDVQVLPSSVKKLIINEGTEDWESGKYLLKDSRAALQTAGIIKKSIEDKLEAYIVPGTKVSVKLIGSTDASPIRSKIPYDNNFGSVKDAEYFINGSFGYVTVTPETGVTTNGQLAYLRTLDLKNFMQKHIGPLRVADCRYEHFAEIAGDRGSQYRRVAVEVTIHNAFAKEYPEIAPEHNENVYERTSDVDMNIPVTGMKQENAVAVVIGNTEYNVSTGKQGTTKVGPVNYAVNDASTMRDYLVRTLGLQEQNIIFEKNIEKKGFDDIFGKDADTEGKLAELVRKTGAKEVYVFYSGHGYPFMGESYLLGVRSNPKSCKEQAISLNYIYKKLGHLDVEHVNVMIDACFSGQGIQMEASATEFARRPKPDKLAKFVILSAANEEQYANWYKEKKHGLFSYVLFKAMQDKANSDTNGDGILTFEELYNYLSDTQKQGVPYLTRELEGEQVQQNPIMQGSKRIEQPFIQY